MKELLETIVSELVENKDAVEVILGGRDIHLVAAAVTGTAVDKGKLERQRAVKVIEE